MVTDINGKPIGMKWYKFLIYFSLFAGALLNFINSFNYLTGSIYLTQANGQITAEDVYAYYGEALRRVDIMFGLFMIAMAIMGLVLRHKLAKYKPDAPKFVYIFYSLSFGASFVYSMLVSTITSISIGASEIGSLIGNVIFLALNIRYFKRRAHLFTGIPPYENYYSSKDDKSVDDEKSTKQYSISLVSDTGTASLGRNGTPLNSLRYETSDEENTMLNDDIMSVSTDIETTLLTDTETFTDCEHNVKELLDNEKIAPSLCQTDKTNAEHMSNRNSDLTNTPPKILFCRKCGTGLKSDSAFCHQCGTKVTEVKCP